MLVSFVQVNFQQGPKESNSYYLPYTVGSLWSYAYSFESVQRAYILGDVIFRRDPIEDTAVKLSHSTIVGFSTYVWNRNYNYTLAKRIKELNPNCILVFGGPEVPVTSLTLFKDYPFMDYVIKKEGEVVFKELLENIYEPTNVKGLLINQRGKIYNTGNADRIENLSQLPSPYTSGFFNDIIKQNPEIEWAATLETNRGCPYQCTFCDWGSLTYSKVKKFNLDKVFDDLEWIGQNQCGFVFIADANFGIFPERDGIIVDKLLDVQEKYGYPLNYAFTWAKNQKQEVVDIALKLKNNKKFNNGLSISVQSMDEKVLENIKRKNLNQHKIEEIFNLCEKNKIPVLTELILGLPGETAESWRHSFWKLFEAGNHFGIDIGQLELLENAEMNLVQHNDYDMKSIPVYDYLGVSDDSILESIQLVNETKDMPFKDMIKSQVFSCFVNTFHLGGFSTNISRFLRKYKNISYEEFYTNLYNFLSKDPWFIKQELDVENDFTQWMSTGVLNDSYVENIEIHGYNIMYKILFKIHLENKYDYVFALLDTYLKNYNLPLDLHSELFKFQCNFIIRYDKLNLYPIKDYFSYNFLEYIEGKELKLEKLEYSFNYLESKDMSMQNFLECIYYWRKRNFGKSIITTASYLSPYLAESFDY